MRYLLYIMAIISLIILLLFFYNFMYSPTEEAPRLIENMDNPLKTIPIPQTVATPQNQRFSEFEPPKEEPEVIQKKQPDIAPPPPDNIINFSYEKNWGDQLRNSLEGFDGMKDMNKLEEYLSKQNFIAVLKTLWSEKDQQKKLKWLKEKEPGSHPILLFELANESFKTTPNFNTLKNSLYLLEYAKLRTSLDTVCIQDSSVKVAAQTLYSNYGRAIAKTLTQNPDLKSELEFNQEEVSLYIIKKLLASLKKLESTIDTLPSPKWTESYALKKLFSNENLALSQKECTENRKALLKVIIDHLNKLIEIKTKTDSPSTNENNEEKIKDTPSPHLQESLLSPA